MYTIYPLSPNIIYALLHSFLSLHEGWVPLREVGWVVVNTDGAGKNNKNSGCGGLIRGNEGEWLGGFAKGLGTCSGLVAELWVALEGLKLAWKKGYKRVELQIDDKDIVKAINKEVLIKAEG
ncbi:hypothetical protein TSUD_137920 [Trifolium subterraneum]|uniref:RNase H type-1 domain-containing protein n=1 Tax=Trifolium subterraneum TaxID=3900 RepID=A0A2Z6NZ46_TRISU|nr:hypothetical protein TSUD_137920 [Trifolium subterraneum]